MYYRGKDLEERLNAYPKLRERFESLLAVVENSAGDLEKADAAEERVIEEVRQMGNEVLQAWAVRLENKKASELRSDKEVKAHGKKKSFGIPPSGK